MSLGEILNKSELLNLIPLLFRVGDKVISKLGKIYSYNGIDLYQGGYSNLFGEKVVKLDTDTSIGVANLFPEILLTLVNEIGNGTVINNKSFHSVLEGVAWVNGNRKFPDLHTNESYYLAMAKAILENMNVENNSLSKFDTLVEQSKLLSKKQRHKRLKNANKQPKLTLKVTYTYNRNHDVVAEVLDQANGVCGRCKKPAPFNRAKDNTPYLEVHHKIRLADKGEDTVENSIALCPTCHRRVHFG